MTGGATAVLLGWRLSTLDVDIKIVPDQDRVLRAIPALKDSLQINVELAAHDQFIPVPDGWRDRSPFITQEGRLSFHHYDPTVQALAKIERGHAQDVSDVREMLARGLVSRDAIRQMFASIERDLYRYPAVDPKAFRHAIDLAVAEP